jgi:hypothetical protein
MHRPRARFHWYRDDQRTVGLPALPGRRVRERLRPTGQGIPPHRGRSVSNWRRPPHPCRGEALPRPPRRMARRFRVADTSHTTRSADQPSGPLHDRPAVNGRAHSPSRLKPADPNGACTQPIDSGAWTPHSPLQGACGFSPGLQPRAHSGRDRHPHTGDGGYCRPCRAGGSGSACARRDGGHAPRPSRLDRGGDVPRRTGCRLAGCD